MSNVKIGIQTRSLRQPLKQAIRTAARLGADGVEIDARNELRPGELSGTGLREFHKLLDDLNLRVSAVAFPTRHGYDELEGLERRVQATQAALRFARELRCDVVVNRVGQPPDDAKDPSFVRLVEALTAIGMYGERVGTRLAAQTGGERPQQLLQLITALPEHSVGVDLHPTGLILGGQSPRDAVDILGPHLFHVHACDAVRDAGGRANEVELGRGNAAIPELLGQLTEFDYRGWVTIERRESANPLEDIESAVAYLRAL
ncbi:MAG TPA: sugar phosphate isomerase/epimerase family protein [Burkholderiaceae bacterium]|nr:sugar phosphate isomerase/epimerase family protein [Burkholderiaceae bacterium]